MTWYRVTARIVGTATVAIEAATPEAARDVACRLPVVLDGAAEAAPCFEVRTIDPAPRRALHVEPLDTGEG